MTKIYKTFGNVTYIFENEDDAKKAAKIYVRSTRKVEDIEKKFKEVKIKYIIHSSI